jgi:hypothetical protein
VKHTEEETEDLKLAFVTGGAGFEEVKGGIL